MQMTLSEIKAKVDQLAERIGASGYVLPTYGRTDDCARPHIETDSRCYYYVIVERGQELERIATNDVDELLYHVFGNITFSLACKFELTHRRENWDCRRLIFKHQVELLSTLSPQWGERKTQEQEKILQQHPYDDDASTRVNLTKEYRDQGYSPEVAWQMACEQYPLPNT
jgi:hypothetical protein